MIARDRVKIYEAATEDNGSGGQVVTDLQGTLVLSSLSEVTEMKPTREELASESQLTKTVKVVLYARKDVTITSDQTLAWNGENYKLQGPPITNALRTEWTLYGKLITP